jgi:hypothetical protein
LGRFIDVFGGFAMSRTPLFAILALAALLAPVGALAQSTGRIVGVVQDPSGAVVPAVDVEATNVLTGLEWTASTDEAGRFVFSRLPVGEYQVRVAVEGFRQFSVRGVSLGRGPES